ncbi:hypothetical protein TKK_0002992 [Trichogramma kaykai]
MQIELKSISPEETNTIEIDDDTRDKDTEKVISDSPSITEADESRKRKAPTDAPPDDSDDSADEEDSVLFIREHQKKARLLVSKAITYSQDTLLSKKNNWAYFMSVDCIAHSEICHQLTDMGYLKTDSLKSHDMKLSMIIETGLDIGKSLFSIFIKDAHDHAVDTDIVNDALDRLADALKNHEIGYVSIPTRNNGIDERSGDTIDKHIQETWPGNTIALTLCSGKQPRKSNPGRA